MTALRCTRAGALLVVVLLFFTTAAPARAQGRTISCIASGQNLYVRDVLSDIYLWNTELPNVDPTRYASPEEYLEAVRYRPLDTHFSFITSRAANDAFYGESQYVGLGVSWTVIGQDLRVLQVFPESPASEAGLMRGDRVTAIGGRPVADLIATNQLDAAIGAAEIGVSLQIQFSSKTGAVTTAQVAKRVVTIPTVSQAQAYLAGGRRVGYIFFRNFVTPSNAALDAAFATLNGARIDDLVLDLRYNGGGLVSVARHLASLIGGAKTSGQVFVEYKHNDKNVRLNQTTRFEDTSAAATLNRLIVITTPASASASELVINALRPFMPVIVVGSRTYGKPVGQYQYDFCDKTLAPVSFSVRNSRGEGDYFDGFAPDCAAADDVEHQLGDVEESSLREALTFATTNACSAAAAQPQRVDRAARDRRAVGWKSIVNAD